MVPMRRAHFIPISRRRKEVSIVAIGPTLGTSCELPQLRAHLLTIADSGSDEAEEDHETEDESVSCKTRDERAKRKC